MINKKKFYVGAPHLVNDPNNHLRDTLAEAIEEAKEECAASDKTQIVVQIVAIIEPAKMPVKVRMLK